MREDEAAPACRRDAGAGKKLECFRLQVALDDGSCQAHNLLDHPEDDLLDKATDEAVAAETIGSRFIGTIDIVDRDLERNRSGSRSDCSQLHPRVAEAGGLLRGDELESPVGMLHEKDGPRLWLGDRNLDHGRGRQGLT